MNTTPTDLARPRLGIEPDELIVCAAIDAGELFFCGSGETSREGLDLFQVLHISSTTVHRLHCWRDSTGPVRASVLGWDARRVKGISATGVPAFTTAVLLQTSTCFLGLGSIRSTRSQLCTSPNEIVVVSLPQLHAMGSQSAKFSPH